MLRSLLLRQADQDWPFAYAYNVNSSSFIMCTVYSILWFSMLFTIWTSIIAHLGSLNHWFKHTDTTDTDTDASKCVKSCSKMIVKFHTVLLATFSCVFR